MKLKIKWKKACASFRNKGEEEESILSEYNPHISGNVWINKLLNSSESVSRLTLVLDKFNPLKIFADECLVLLPRKSPLSLQP